MEGEVYLLSIYYVYPKGIRRSRTIIVRTIGGKFFMPRGLNLFGYLDGKPNITLVAIHGECPLFSIS